MNGQGARLRQIALQNSQTQRIAKAIRLLRENFAQPLRVGVMARDVHMSLSSLYHHFKAVTAMSRLQYQKQLQVREEITKFDTGTTFLLTEGGLFLIRRPVKEMN
jgi:AraC-like DNA-binding protein